eukprot:g2019.t1
MVLRWHHSRKEYVFEWRKWPLWENAAIGRKLSGEGARAVVDELIRTGHAEWNDVGKSMVTLMWHSAEEIAAKLFDFVRKHDMVGSVFTVYELHQGDDVLGTDFFGMDEGLFRKALSVLENQGRAVIFKGATSEEDGVKFVPFFTLAGDVQLRIVSFLDVGLSAGHCSAVRLRLSCEGCQLIELLVELLKGLTARGEGDGGSSTAQHDSELIEVVGRVLGMVCSAGIGVYELKRVLRELRVPSALTPPLVGALTLMAGRNESLARMQSSGNREETADPYCCEIMESMFDFGGDGAGLVLPVALWPFPQEYQLVAWVRVDQSAASPADGAKVRGAATRAHLVTFTTEKGAGVDYYIKDSRLFVDVADGGGGGPIHPTVVDMGAAGLISGRWHALVISHRRSSKLLFNKDHLEVFVDGKLSFSASVPYPRRISEPLARCSIGSNLDGQTSGVVLLSGVASLKITKSMLNRLAGRLDDVAEGADTFGNSSPDLDLWDDKATVSAQQRLKRTLLGSKYHIFAALLPNRTVDDLCLEPHNGHHGLLRRGTTHVWITHTVQDVIRSIGGTPSLLSLANGLLSEAPGVSLGRRKNNSFIGQSVDIVLSVLLSFLDGNVANQGDFFFAGGVEILQVLLRSAPKMRFSSAGTHTVMVLERIFQTCRSDRLSAYIQQALPGLTEDAYRPEAGVSSLPHQILLCLLANFPLWARAPPEFQFGLVTSVLDVARDEPELCRQSLPLERVLVSVRVCCPDQIPGEAGQSLGGERTGVSGFMSSETTSESSADLSGTTSTDADWTIMARRERLHMRGFLWELVRLLLGREVGKQDGEAIVHFLASCDDTRLVCELVQVLGSLMRKPVPPSGLFWALESASCVDRGVASRRRGPRTGRPLVHAGFLSLVLERSVLVTGASEDLRVAGLRVANVFMARSAKANEREAVAAGGESMDSKVSSVFPLLSEGLVRDRHILGEATYAALLEMALLGDERDLPWAEQDSVVGVVEANYRFKRHNNSDLGSQEGRRSEETSTEDEDLTAGVWWDCGSQDVDARGGTGHVLDDAQLIRNVLPLALILQYLPTMASSVQVRSHGDLLLMLKLNEANRQKVMELSHVHDGKFWGIWERCMFLMMAPLFSRGVSGHTAELDSRDGISQDGERKGDYFMVLRLYAILLEHAMSFDEDGYKEIAVAASLQHLIPHGRVAVRVLLAQLAFEAAEEMESQAVREAGERTRRWRELANRTAPGSDVTVLSADEKANKVLETIQQEALNAEASRKIKTGCRLLASRRRLQCYLRTLCAAWSPWAAGNNSNGGHEPRGWEVSSHKDQLMRQMLLVPVDTDVGHADEAYAGTTRRPGDGDAHRDPAMISGVQPSRSLLAGVDFIFDDDEVTDGEVDNDQSSSAAESFGHAGATAEPAEWEHIPPPGALQVESVVSVQSTASQQEQEHVTTTATGGSASSQRVFGRWRATNVLRQGSVPGILYLFEESLVFEGERNEIEDSDEAAAAGPLAGQTWRWRLGRLTQVHLRRFLLRPQAIELFWADSPEVFLAFEDVTARQTFTRHLRKRNVPMLPVITRQGILHPRKVLKACRLTESWRRRQISNFQYIMALNVIAGRSFNDISQYPVFPWVLADYSSSELDLNNPSSFRDLSRPMGALNEQRRRLFVERYASFEDEMVPKFMYGTHYSSAGVVLHYLVRQDPFTSLHVNLQGGRFDCPDRLFYDMGQSWKACADGNSMSDVKELTPEFFYSPEIFLNSNKLPLGEMQGERGSVDDVRLPPWAKDAFDFVRIHRLALESEHVSKHLHRWIDLIFGYQQRGDEAVKAANVFYYLTYEGAVDLSLVNDARQREAMEAQIHHFGQTPSQVLKEPHPVRLPPEECVLPIFSPTSTVECLRRVQCQRDDGNVE